MTYLILCQQSAFISEEIHRDVTLGNAKETDGALDNMHIGQVEGAEICTGHRKDATC